MGALRRLIKNNIAFVAALAAIALLRSRYDPYVVMTGSMEPAVRVGAIVVIDSHAEPGIGDVGAYASGGNIIIHRVIGYGDGGYTFKGDANRDPDPAAVADGQVRGKAVLTLNAAAGITRSLGLVR